MKYLNIFIFLFFSFTLLGEETNRYRDSVLLGERNFKEYSGPLYPDYYYDELSGEVLARDDAFYDTFFNDKISSEVTDLEFLWFDYLPLKSSCPDFFLNKNIDYIRYLFRLGVMSYLYEELKILKQLAYEVEGEKNKCAFNWDTLFKDCRPKNLEMKKFVKRSKNNFLDEVQKNKLAKKKKNALKAWHLKFKRSLKNGKKGIALERVRYWCKKNNKNCSKISLKNIRYALSSSCKEDMELFRNICSEKDSLFGISYDKRIIEVLKSSNVLNVINEGGYGLQCLKRYSNLVKRKEKRYPYLSLLTESVYAHLKNTKGSPLQGKLFIRGALKEFDDKGLGDFLFVERPKVEPKVVVKPKVKPRPAPKTKPVVVKPKPRPRPVVIKPKPKAKKIKPKIVLTQFAKAYKFLKKFKLQKVKVNMRLFRKDKAFKKSFANKLLLSLKPYYSRKGLGDMKELDKLGEKVQPYRLRFLKLVLDKNDHQSLYNITAIIGKKFWVVNDIDKGMKDPVWIELVNDSSTGFKWQIFIFDKK